LSYVMESPHEKKVIWTGSDDGLVHISKDGGIHWQNVTPPGLKECLINAIEVSPHSPGTIYIATTRYKFNDHTPALYKTSDYGKTWSNISKGIPDGAFTRVVREDQVRKDLLFAGTETGIYISWNGGKEWSPFQLNLPITPITDLKVHMGNLIAATSGRSFWILDDLGFIRQYQKDTSAFVLYQPDPVILANGSSELDAPSPEFKGSHPTRGVNPATGAVFYYQLPDPKPGDVLLMEIKDEMGKPVRSFSSKKDSLFMKYDGGPPAEPVLPKAKGLNRFVWNLRHQTAPGIPGVYIESSYRGHKAIPGKYSVELKIGDRSLRTNVDIKTNVLYPTDAKTYFEYHSLMSEMEKEVTDMHQMVNMIFNKRLQMEQIIASLTDEVKFKSIKDEGVLFVKSLKQWDEEMVQRKSKAYDDVENFPNKFTANYMFLINQTESDIPRVNQSSLDRLKELNEEWSVLQARGNEFLNKNIPAFNRQLWDVGIGAIWKN
ncbi:MAG: exo-alpha-sialidase, partial [Saprospiraceae bacterium]|nr:exo-alpha-sialidase [Saprospiraceae bacterium]